MVTNEIQLQNDDGQIMEAVLLGGDLSRLSPQQRVTYYRRVCESLGLNPLTRPFDYIKLKKKDGDAWVSVLTLYAKKEAADQLRKNNQVSIDDIEIQETDKHFTVKVKGHDGAGRSDVEIGVVAKEDMRGDYANAKMKAITKAKRRFTLSICGLGWLDETEVQTIPDARPVQVSESGEIMADAETENQETGEYQPPRELINTMGAWAVEQAANFWNITPADAAREIAKANLGKMEKQEFLAWLRDGNVG